MLKPAQLDDAKSPLNLLEALEGRSPENFQPVLSPELAFSAELKPQVKAIGSFGKPAD